MTTKTRRRVAVLGATLLLALALAGPAVATAQAAGTSPGGTATTTAVQTFHPGRGAGTLGPNPPAPSAASVIGALAVTIAVVGIASFVMLSLGRRGAVRLQSVEGSGPVSGAGSSTETEDQKRKAA
jgi:hypothetical protein